MGGIARHTEDWRAKGGRTMRRTLRKASLAGVMAVVALAGLGTTTAEAQLNGGHHGGGHHGGGHHGYVSPGGFPGGYGGGHHGGFPGGGYQQYYGNGGHDFQPHWHRSTTPFGTRSWYGNGAHDLRPHEHVRSPYGGYRGYSPNPFGGVTESIYPSTPYTYMPW